MHSPCGKESNSDPIFQDKKISGVHKILYMISSVKIQNLKFYRGAHAGLSGKTVIITLLFDDLIEEWTVADEYIRDNVIHLRAGDPLFDIRANDWPDAFLVVPDTTFSIANWIVALTTAFQRWARDPVMEGRIVSVSGSTLVLALVWEREQVFKSALQFALRYLLLWGKSVVASENAVRLTNEFEDWLIKAQSKGLSPNSMRFALSACKRRIPVSVSESTRTLRLGWGINSLRMDSSFTDFTGTLATRIARNKFQTTLFLHQNGVPVPPGSLVFNQEQAHKRALQLGWPLVIKPSDKDQGVGVVPGISDKTALTRAFDAALKLSPRGVILEKHVAGEDYRMLLVGGKLLMATRRVPGGVTGNGTSSVAQLVKEVNDDPRRGTGKRSLLIALNLDGEAIRCLLDQGLTPESVPETGHFVRLRLTANISTGGTAVDVTTLVHSDNRKLVERAARLIGLDIAGVDFLCPDISRSWFEVGGTVIEVNAQPGFRVHWLSDPDRDINGEIIDWLFRAKSARVPTAAITGTNGKSTTARMLHHIWMTAGKNAGVCATNGVLVGYDIVSYQNLTGYTGGRILLEDPAVEAAVFEMPRKGLLLFGHPCDHYDVAALLNVQNDHIGVDGINSLEEMARLKAGVLERAIQAVVVNAEDTLCLEMRKYASAPRHILVARNPLNPALLEHLDQGGAGVYTEMRNGRSCIVLAEGAAQSLLMPLDEIPASMNGLLRFNETNALFAAALAWSQGITTDIIRRALRTFASTPEQNPGRFNFIEGFEFQVLLDYAHNPDGVLELCEMVSKLPVTGIRRLLNLNIGNRHRMHLDETAPYLARTFDHFVLSCDHKRVHNNPEWAGDDPIESMLEYSRACLSAQGVAQEAMTSVPENTAALKKILANGQPGDLLVLLSGPRSTLPFLKKEEAGQ